MKAITQFKKLASAIFAVIVSALFAQTAFAQTGTPDKVVFLQPMPKSQLGGATPPTINGTYDVEVQVQDRYGNPVNTRVSVYMVSSQPNIGDVWRSVADTDPATGSTYVTAFVTKGKTGDIFNLIASINQSGASKPSDTASLRVGAVDRLMVFYHQSTPPKDGPGYWRDDYDNSEVVDALAGSWKQVWVKVINYGGDTIVTSKSAHVCVTASDPNIKFSATESNTAVSGQYLATVTNGMATFWITSNGPVDMVSLTVSARTSADCDGVKDNSIIDGSRGNITFKVAAYVGAGTAIVKGDGYARPNYVEIMFTGGGWGTFNAVSGAWRKPDSVKLSWPGICYEALSAKSTDFTYLNDGVTIGVRFYPAVFPEGYSAPLSASGALVTVYGAIESGTINSPFALIDSIGPVIARPRPVYCGAEQFISPTFNENTSPGVTPYVLRLQTTEPLANSESLVGQSILISSDESGTDETALTVAEVAFVSGVYALTLSQKNLLASGFWIRLNPNHPGITDNVGNRAAIDNRRVQIFQRGEVSIRTPNRAISVAKPFGIVVNGTGFQIVGTSQATPVRVYDMRGKVLMNRTAMPNERISVSHLARGMYVVEAVGKSVKLVR